MIIQIHLNTIGSTDTYRTHHINGISSRVLMRESILIHTIYKSTYKTTPIPLNKQNPFRVPEGNKNNTMRPLLMLRISASPP